MTNGTEAPREPGGPGSKIPTSIKREVRDRQQDQCNTIDPNVCPKPEIWCRMANSPTNPANRLKLYWTKGEGALKIRWGTPGDFDRCVRQLREHVRDPEGLCNVYHQAAVGAPPGKGH